MDKHRTLKTLDLVPHETDTTLAHIGKRFERLTVHAIGKKPRSYRYVAVCSCSCGTKQVVLRLDKITSGHTRSCGCLQADSVTTHGLYSHRLYPVWNSLMGRCYQKTDSRFYRYGGRGISVCKRWHDPASFIEDMEPTYKAGLQIERKDNDGNYQPSNCRWATHSEQQRNRGNNIRITINGETKVLAEWCRVYGIRYGLAHERITKQHWEPLKALTHPVHK